MSKKRCAFESDAKRCVAVVEKLGEDVKTQVL
jgi:hypothetical protein